MAEAKKKSRKRRKKGSFFSKIILFIQLIILLLAVIGTVITVLLLMNVITVEDLYPYILKIPYVGERYIAPFIYPEKNPKITIYDILEKEAYIVEREEKLKELENRLLEKEKILEDKEKELAKRYQEVDDLKEELSAKLLRKKTTWDKNIEALVNLYGSMSPNAAAKILEKVDSVIVVEVMRRMNSKKASLIMEKFPPDFAAKISKELSLKTD